MTYLTLRETALKFGVSEATIRRLVKSESIPFSRSIGPLRFPASTLDDWAREPEQVTARWFGGIIDDSRKVEDGNEEGEDLGSALFLSSRER